MERIEKEARDSLPSYLDDLLLVARKARAAPAPPSSSSLRTSSASNTTIDERKAKIKNICKSEREKKTSSSAVGSNRLNTAKKTMSRQTASSYMNKNITSINNKKGNKMTSMNSKSRISTSAQPKSSSSLSSSSSSSSLCPKKEEEEEVSKVPTYKELVEDLIKQIRLIKKFKKSDTHLSLTVVDKKTLVAQSKFLTLLMNGFETPDIADYNQQIDEEENAIDVDEIISGKEKEKKPKRITLISTSMDWLYKSLQDDLPMMHSFLHYETQPDDDYPFQKALMGAEELKRLLLIYREEYERVLQPKLRRIPPSKWTTKDAEEIAFHWLRLRLLYGIYENTVLQVMSNEAVEHLQEDGSHKDPSASRPLHMQALACIQNLPLSAVESELSPIPLEEVGHPDWLAKRTKAIHEYHNFFQDCMDVHDESIISKYILKDRVRKLKDLCDQNRSRRSASEMDEDELRRWRETLKDCQLLHNLLVNRGDQRRKTKDSSDNDTNQKASGKRRGRPSQLLFFEK